MTKKRIFSKPNMANLHGKIGRSIIKTIRETPKLDREKLNKTAKATEKRIYAAESKRHDVHY